jgi:ABC-type branched-subunit amino acid transport system ATPase component
VMEHGQVGIGGLAQQLLRDPRVIESYLGVGRAAAQEA